MLDQILPRHLADGKLDESIQELIQTAQEIRKYTSRLHWLAMGKRIQGDSNIIINEEELSL